MRVCHMTSVHDPEDVRIYLKECVTLASEGYDVYLVQAGNSYKKNGVNIVGFGQPSNNRIKRIFTDSKKALKKAIETDADVYHFHDPELIPCGKKLKRLGKKVIFDSHENTADAILEKPYIPKAFRNAVRSVYIHLEKNACKKFDAVITVTPTQTEYYKQLGANVVEIRNSPIISEEFSTPSFSAPSLVFAGGVSKQWNHHVLIKALEQLPNCRYVLIGQDNDYRKSLENLPAWSQVEYKGKMAHQEVMRALSDCMIGMVLLSPGNNTAGKTGTLGNTKIFEDMIAGLPIICTDFDLWRDFVEEYNCGICVDPSDKAAIVAAIKKLVSDPDLCREMGKNGQRAIKERFNWDIEKEKLLSLYKSLQK